MGKKTQKSENGHLDELRELVADGVGEVARKRTDRRGMLRMAGAAVLGAAGAAALKAVPASAASGNFMVVGCDNTSSTQTTLTTSAANTGANVYLIGNTNQYGLVSGANAGSNEIGLYGISKSGSGNGVRGDATTGIGVYGNATTGEGVHGVTTTGTGVTGSGNTGVSGSGAGVGVAGLSTAGHGNLGQSTSGRGGLFTSATGYDVALGYPVAGGAVGSGRLGMVGRLDTGNNAPNIAPAFAVTSTGAYTFEHEFVRGNDGSIWASRFIASGTNQSRWKRINSLRVDTADGLGTAYKPFRRLDSRTGARKAAGSITVLSIAGSGTGDSLVPADAKGVVGNLTAVGYTGGGFLVISPAGVTVGTSSLNFPNSGPAIANAFVCGLSSNGSLQVKVAGHSTHILVDITGYIQ